MGGRREYTKTKKNNILVSTRKQWEGHRNRDREDREDNGGC